METKKELLNNLKSNPQIYVNLRFAPDNDTMPNSFTLHLSNGYYESGSYFSIESVLIDGYYTVQGTFDVNAIGDTVYIVWSESQISFYINIPSSQVGLTGHSMWIGAYDCWTISEEKSELVYTYTP